MGTEETDDLVCIPSSAPTIDEGDKAVFEENTLAFTVNAFDDDGDPLTYTMSTNAAGASLDATSGNFSWTPASDSAGTYYANFTANDSKEEAWQNITITVLEPAVFIQPNVTIGFAPLHVEFELNATDTSLVATNSMFDDGRGGEPEDLGTFDNATRSVEYGIGTYTAWINGTYNETPFRHHVTIQVSEPPLTLGPVGDQRVFEEHDLAFILAVTNDEAEDPVTYSLETNATGAALNNTTGEFEWTPASGSAGSYYANFTVNDSEEEAWQNITITVLEPAVFIQPNVTIGFAPLHVEFELNATDTSLVATNSMFDDGRGGEPEDLGTFDNATRSVEYGIGTYTAWINGTYDGVPFSHNVSLASMNNPPVLDLIADPPVAYEGQEIAFDPTASDADGHFLDFRINTNVPRPEQEVFTDNQDGSATFSWIPAPGEDGTYYANITVTDSLDATDHQNVTIMVGPRSTSMTSTWPGGIETEMVTFTLNASDPAQVSDATFDDGKGLVVSLTTFENQTRTTGYDPGTYTVWFNGTYSGEGTFNHLIQVTVLPEDPMNFTATGVEGTSPLPVTFTMNATDWTEVTDAILDPGNGSAPHDVDFSENGSIILVYDQNETYTAWFNGTHTVTGPFNHNLQIHLNNSAPIIEPFDDVSTFGGREVLFQVPVTDTDVEDEFSLQLESNATGASVDSATGEFHWRIPQTTTGTFYANITANDTKDEGWHNFSITVQTPSTTFEADSAWVSAPHTVRFTFKTLDWDKVSDTTVTYGKGSEISAPFVADDVVDISYDDPGIYVAWFNGTHETEGEFWYKIPVQVDPNTPPEFAPINNQTVVKNHTLDFTVTAADTHDMDLMFGLHTNATNYTSEDLHPANARNFTWTPTENETGWYYANFTAHDGKGGVAWKNITITVTELSTAFSSDVTTGYAPLTVTFVVNAMDWDDDIVFANTTFDAGDGSEKVPVSGNTSIPVTYESPATAWFNGTHEDEGDFNHSIQISIKVPPVPPIFDPPIPGLLRVVENGSIEQWVHAIHTVNVDSDLTYGIDTNIVDDPTSLFTANGTVGGRDFAWETDYGDAGTYYANFTVMDTFGGETFHNVTIEILDNQAPVLKPIEDQEVVEGKGLFIPVEVLMDEDPESLAFNVATDVQSGEYIFGRVVGGPESAAFAWSPDFGAAGTYYVNFTATDPEGLVGHENVTITILPNTAPVLEAIGGRTITEGDWIGFTVPANDPDGHVLTYGLESDLPSEDANHAAFNQTTGEFTWTATFGDAGVYYADFSVSDGGATVHENVTITVLGNAAPVLESIGHRSVKEGDTIAFHVNASDPEGDTITFGPLTGAKTNITGASYKDNVLLGGKDFNWTPTSQDIGLHYANFTVSDGNQTAWENVTITVRPSLPPVLDPIGDLSIEEGDEYHRIIKATDPGDEVSLVFSFKSNSTDVSFNPDNQEFSWEPEIGTVGWYWAEFKVTDDDGLTDMENVTLTVLPYTPDLDTDSSSSGGGGGGTRSATASERNSLTSAGIELADDEEVTFVDDDGDGNVDSITSSSGRLEVAHNVDSIRVIVFTDKQTGKMAVMDFATGEASPVKGIEESDIKVKPVRKPSTDEEEQFDVTVPKEEGWIHIEIDDPAPGQNITSLNRSDGVVLELDQAWRTVDGRLHIIDDPDTTYTVGFEPAPKDSKVGLWIMLLVLGALVVAGGVFGGIYWWRNRQGRGHSTQPHLEGQWSGEDPDAELDDSWALASELPD